MVNSERRDLKDGEKSFIIGDKEFRLSSKDELGEVLSMEIGVDAIDDARGKFKELFDRGFRPAVVIPSKNVKDVVKNGLSPNASWIKQVPRFQGSSNITGKEIHMGRSSSYSILNMSMGLDPAIFAEEGRYIAFVDADSSDELLRMGVHPKLTGSFGKSAFMGRVATAKTIPASKVVVVDSKTGEVVETVVEEFIGPVVPRETGVTRKAALTLINGGKSEESILDEDPVVTEEEVEFVEDVESNVFPENFTEIVDKYSSRMWQEYEEKGSVSSFDQIFDEIDENSKLLESGSPGEDFVDWEYAHFIALFEELELWYRQILEEKSGLPENYSQIEEWCVNRLIGNIDKFGREDGYIAFLSWLDRRVENSKEFQGWSDLDLASLKKDLNDAYEGM